MTIILFKIIVFTFTRKCTRLYIIILHGSHAHLRAALWSWLDQVWSSFYGPRDESSHRALDLPKSMAWAMSAITVVDFFPLLICSGSSGDMWQRMLPLEPVLGGWLLSSHTPSHDSQFWASVGLGFATDLFFLCLLGPSPNSQQSSLISPMWRKRILPSVPTDRSQGQRGH